jgi:GTPase Era involved in 16S rRNA processing
MLAPVVDAWSPGSGIAPARGAERCQTPAIPVLTKVDYCQDASAATDRSLQSRALLRRSCPPRQSMEPISIRWKVSSSVPAGREPLYPPDYLTDQTERFYVSEIVREQVLKTPTTSCRSRRPWS